ncbi:hypothetical protein [Natrarchaeobius oligotrophus]|uniref:DUF7847 domain-containing protein n=1 Tax=Natrarchaeobius chitinivorans TaxID=1679083 RepID=A0A3N6MFN0_NATCH|nr:hypothetical protein [Natrarchaeobius chitinivorans]RQH01738.1 hypothetical protein EA472_05270 [Natrarchaeobius chitinivorans]
MVDRIERREDVDGCACLECRGVSAGVTRRRIGDVLLWAVGVLRNRRSILLVFLAVAAVQFVGFVGPPAVEVTLSFVVFTGGLFARSYAGTIVAGELVDRRYAPTTAAAHALRRLPAVVATLLFTFLSTMALTVVGVLAGAAVLFADSPVVTAAGIVALAVTVVLVIVVLVKFILAPEAVVVGGYGPIAALAVSWGLVSFRRRTTIVLVSLVVAIATAFAITEISAATATHPVVGSPPTRLVVLAGSSLATYLSGAITAIVFAHLYVQRILE